MSNELNVAEKFWIANHQSKGVDKLAEELKVPKALVEFELNVLKQKEFEQERLAPEELKNPRAPAKDSEVTQCVKDDSPLLKSFVRRKEGGICAMSSSAAMLSDEILKKAEKKSLSETRPDCVGKCR